MGYLIESAKISEKEWVWHLNLGSGCLLCYQSWGRRVVVLEEKIENLWSWVWVAMVSWWKCRFLRFLESEKKSNPWSLKYFEGWWDRKWGFGAFFDRGGALFKLKFENFSKDQNFWRSWYLFRGQGNFLRYDCTF